jgi:hypothetical protein
VVGANREKSLVHEYTSCLFIRIQLFTYGINFTPTLSSAPVPLFEKLKVGHVNNCILALRKWNQAVGWVERLNNRVSFHAFFHRSSSQGLLEFSRYFNMESTWN